MQRPVLRRSPLSYPGGLAGFDPQHVAAGDTLFSGVADQGGKFRSVLDGKPAATSSGTPTLQQTRFGPGIKFNAATDNNTFPYPAVAWPAQTMACIVRFDTLGSNVQVIQATAAGGSSGFYIANAGTGSGSQWAFVAGVTFVSIGGIPAPVPGATYFAALSVLSGNYYSIVVKRLDTGQTWRLDRIPTVLTFIAGDTTLYIGNRGTNTRQTLGVVHATMHSTRYLSSQQMMQWSEDPWSFWYPPESDLGLMAGTATAATATGTLAATETTDTASFTGAFNSSGTLATTETPDVASFNGIFNSSGTLAVTEQADIAAFAGTFDNSVSGILSATELPDIGAFTGNFVASAVTGTLAVTEAQDRANFTELIAGGYMLGGQLFKPKHHTSTTENTIKQAAAIMSSIGGNARAKALTSTQRSSIASNAARSRWK